MANELADEGHLITSGLTDDSIIVGAQTIEAADAKPISLLAMWTYLNAKISSLATYVPGTRTLTAAGLVTGGGDLTANRTFTVTEASEIEATTGTASTVVMTPRRSAAVKAVLVADLAATTTGKGASLIGIEDAGGLITGATVEAALAENRAAIDALETSVTALDQAVVLKGTWDASAGTFPGAGAAQAGWKYIVSVGGTVNGVAFVANDTIVAIADNASTTTYAANWHQFDHTDAVLSVAGKTGAVTLEVADVGIASQVEAEAGSANDKAMTPLRTAQAIAALAPASSSSERTVSGANDLLAGEEGIAFDFISRTAVINDHADVLSDSGRPQDLLTVTRASTATYVGRNRLLQTASTNTLRYHHDPATGAPKGVLIEGAATNLLTYSEQFDNAAWTKSAATVTANAVIAPDGTTTADKLTESASTDHHFVSAGSLTIAVTYTISVWAKAAERSWLKITSWTSYANFNLSSGAVGNVGVGSAQIEAFPNGWYRCSLTLTAIDTQGAVFAPETSDSASFGASYAGDGTSGIYIWGAQLETGSVASSYIASTSATVARSADAPNIATSLFPLDATQGTLFVEAQNNTAYDASSFPVLVELVSDSGNRLGIFGYSASYYGFMVTGSVEQASIASGAHVAGSTDRVAVAYTSNDIAVSVNGASPVTDTSASLPSVTSFTIGYEGASNLSHFNGYIRRVFYVSRRMTNAEIIALTA